MPSDSLAQGSYQRCTTVPARLLVLDDFVTPRMKFVSPRLYMEPDGTLQSESGPLVPRLTVEAPKRPVQTGRRGKSKGGERPPTEPPVTVAEPPDSLDLILLTREQAAKRCGVGLNKIDEWSTMPGFPVIREGGHFVRIHAGLLDEWLAQRAALLNPPQPPPPPQLSRRNPRRRP